ncbi:hypothetical protein ACIPY3_19470 [Paenarthrobacter sp. NPDC089714]|uniref:hypothetical protein n=1 Tax=Paenarthrobacter sp. NPDC089714 TaxID=3364377 RepID=UPI0037F86D88
MGVDDGVDEGEAFVLLTELAVDVPPHAVANANNDPMATNPNAFEPRTHEDLRMRCWFLDVRIDRVFKIVPPLECADAMARDATITPDESGNGGEVSYDLARLQVDVFLGPT